jgi:hypothetical protein
VRESGQSLLRCRITVNVTEGTSHIVDPECDYRTLNLEVFYFKWRFAGKGRVVAVSSMKEESLAKSPFSNRDWVAREPTAKAQSCSGFL